MVCEHNQINYKTLDSLAKQQQKFIVGQMKKIEQLEDEKRNQGNMEYEIHCFK